MKKYLSVLWYIAAAAIIILDFTAKRHIMASYAVGEVFGMVPGIADFVYVKNTGAAFSILSNNTVILGAVSVIFCIGAAVYWIIKKDKHFMLSLSIMLLFSGAAGNAIDRIAYKYVVDFISIKWFDFPVFNIADMAIVSGAIAAILYVILFDRDKKDNG